MTLENLVANAYEDNLLMILEISGKIAYGCQVINIKWHWAFLYHPTQLNDSPGV